MPKQSSQLELDHQRLVKQEKSLRKDMGKQRVKQLKMANDDEDKTIRKLEKLLKIDKTKGKKSIPKMFHDGLDYALEMCLPENIEKMYVAAKEAADANQQFDSEWEEDFALATGEVENNKTMKQNEQKSNKIDKMKNKQKSLEQKKASHLREIESKYFGASDDDLASDLSEIDSEFEKSDNESANDDQEDCIEGSGSDFESDSDNEPPEEIATVSNASKNRKAEKLNESNAAKQKKTSQSKAPSESDDETDNDSLDDEEESENELDIEKSLNSSDEGDSEIENESNESKPEIWEDIYGRKRDKHGNVIKETPDNSQSDGKYIPPHLRAKLAINSNDGTANDEIDPKRREKLMQLKKLLKGLMNRLSEANMHKISNEIDSLYMKNSRYDMNTTLIALICESLILHALAPERMVMEHCLLIAALHANVGMEVGANLLETLVDRFNEMISSGIQQYDVEDKTLDNVIFILCHMYTFKVSNYC